MVVSNNAVILLAAHHVDYTSITLIPCCRAIDFNVGEMSHIDRTGQSSIDIETKWKHKSKRESQSNEACPSASIATTRIISGHLVCALLISLGTFIHQALGLAILETNQKNICTW